MWYAIDMNRQMHARRAMRMAAPVRQYPHAVRMLCAGLMVVAMAATAGCGVLPALAFPPSPSPVPSEPPAVTAVPATPVQLSLDSTPAPAPMTPTPSPVPTPEPTPEPPIPEAWYLERCDLLRQNLARFGNYADEAEVEAAVAAMAIDPARKMVALTFDDGPNPSTTRRILQTLSAYGGRATFFLLGERIEQSQSVIQELLAAGCELGNHTWSHTNLAQASPGKVNTAVSLVNERIEELYGYRLRLLRPPFGEMNSEVRYLAHTLDMAIVRWNVDTLDWSSRDPDKIFANATTDIKNGDIILFHDIYDTTADAIERVVPELIAQGFQLVTVSELLQCSDGGLTYGEAYRHG